MRDEREPFPAANETGSLRLIDFRRRTLFSSHVVREEPGEEGFQGDGLLAVDNLLLLFSKVSSLFWVVRGALVRLFKKRREEEEVEALV